MITTPSKPHDRSADTAAERAVSSVVELLSLNAKLLAVEADASAHSLKVAAVVGLIAVTALIAAGPLLLLAFAVWLHEAQGWETAPALVLASLVALFVATVSGAVALRYAKQTASCVSLSFKELAENLRALAGQGAAENPNPTN